jgi:hypothetical protein
MSSDAKILNEWIRVLPQFHDPMNDYRPGTLWLDTDSGTYGDARTLVLINTTDWSAEDHDAWEGMTDSERGSYGADYIASKGKSVGPLEYQRETGCRCDKCECSIDLDGEGGHIYPDGSVLCPICEDAE